MSIRSNGHRLQYELDVRCMSARNLAHLTGLSDATVSNALASRCIAAASMRLIADVLATTPVSDFMRDLIGPYVPPPSDPGEGTGPTAEAEA